MALSEGAAAIALLRDELRIVAGPVPAPDPAAPGSETGFAVSRDGFVLAVSPLLRFQYRRGHGIRFAASAGIDDSAVETFHHGAVHGAVAWMNGFVPLHASAVVSGGGVHAFAGVSGEGKSTLIAALGARGLRRFADDIVTLSVSADGPPLALPGHKRLKLWSDACTLTGQTGTRRVWPGMDKFYIEDEDLPSLSALPLASITLLESGDADSEMTIAEVKGVTRIMALRDACYRPDLRSQERLAATFAQLATVTARVPLFECTRPRDAAQFDRGVDQVVRHLRSITA